MSKCIFDNGMESLFISRVVLLCVYMCFKIQFFKSLDQVHTAKIIEP